MARDPDCSWSRLRVNGKSLEAKEGVCDFEKHVALLGSDGKYSLSLFEKCRE